LQAELEAENLLRARTQASEAEIAATKQKIESSRVPFSENISDVARETAARYGIAPESVAGPSILRAQEDLEAASEEALSLRGVRERQENVNRTFNFVFGRLVSAGFGVAEAKRTAMQYALDEDRRRAESASSGKARQLVTEKQDILDRYAARILDVKRKAAEKRRKEAIKNSMLRTFFGIAGSLGTAYALGPAGAAAKIGAAGAGGAVASEFGPQVFGEFENV